MPRSILVIIITVCIAMFTSVAFTEENAPNGGTVRGAVFDTTWEQNPLEGVEVQIVDINNKVVTVKTDATGQYKCDNLPAGRYLINISKKGYVDRVGRAVTIVENGDHFVQLKMLKQNDTDKRFTEMFFKYVAESIGERYKLEKSSVEALYQSILEIFAALAENLGVIFQKGSMGANDIVSLLLSRPDSKAAFAKHLTETQIHDYIEFIENRQQRVGQTTARFLTVVLDQTLSLNPKQREDVLKLLLDTTAHSLDLSPASMFGGYNLQREVVDLLSDESKIFLHTILTPTQIKIWQGLLRLKKSLGIWLVQRSFFRRAKKSLGIWLVQRSFFRRAKKSFLMIGKRTTINLNW